MTDEIENAGVLFRVASEPSAGGGHVSRCLVIASGLRHRMPVHMVLDPGAEAAAAQCEKAGVQASLGRPANPNARWGACVLDGYDFSPTEIAHYAALAPLVVMDDFGQPPAGAALAINSAIHLTGDRLGGVPALLGPRYALVAPRFAALAAGAVPREVSNVLVTLGRIDPDNATGLALRALSVLRERGLALRAAAVVGTESQAALIEDEFGDRIALLVDVDDMAPLLAKADLVIGAGGVSLFERMAAGVPSVSLIIAENQRLFVEGAVAEGATIFAGNAHVLSDRDLADNIEALCRDWAGRQRMSDRGRALVDGRGVERVAEVLIGMCAEPRRTATA